MVMLRNVPKPLIFHSRSHEFFLYIHPVFILISFMMVAVALVVMMMVGLEDGQGDSVWFIDIGSG